MVLPARRPYGPNPADRGGDAWLPVVPSLPAALRATGDRRLARRLTREAALAERAVQRQARWHARAVQRWERQMWRARRTLPVEILASGGLLAVGAGTNDSFPLVALGAIVGLRAVRSASLLLRRTPPPAPAPTPVGLPVAPPPPPGSAAWPAIRRLERVRADLGALLPLVTPQGRDAAEQAWQVAAESDASLRWMAARLAAVEPHRGPQPDLLRRLEGGVLAQEGVVQAMADLVAACADPLATARLEQATDALHGLAAGLREVQP